METALVVSGNGGEITRLLSRVTDMRIKTAASAAEAEAMRDFGPFDLYIIDAPGGETLAARLAEQLPGEVIMLAGAEEFFEVTERLSARGVLVVQKPLDERTLRIALKTAEAAHSRVLRVSRENTKLQRELEDLKVINRAKLVLISSLKMTEPEAHRYIEKQAMDMRLSRREIAEGILKTYEY